MTRKIALTLAACALLAAPGCKKLSAIHLPWKKQAAEAAASGSTTPGAPAQASSATSVPSLPEPPPRSDGSAAAIPVSAPANTLVPPAPGAPAAPSVPIDQNASAICLCYHNIEDNSKMKALTISVAEFEKEMKAIKDNGFTVIGMQDFLAWRRGEKGMPHKSCIVSIDDGWVSAYTNAWPILKKYNYPFTLFIYLNYVGSGGKSLSWDQLEQMRDAGVDIESHTYSHSDLKKPGALVDPKSKQAVLKDVATLGVDGWLKKEIVDSKKDLEKQLGIRVNAFAYPFGIYNEKARQLVKEAGYEAAFTVYGQRLTRSSPFDLLGRYAVEASKPKIFEDAMAMIGGGVSPTEAPPSMGQLAATSMITEPANDATINNPQPRIMANLATMGDLDPASVEVRVSGLGVLPAHYDAGTKTLTSQVAQKLKPGTYTVIVSAKASGQRVETRWNFKFDPKATPTGGASAADAPIPPPNVLGR